MLYYAFLYYAINAMLYYTFRYYNVHTTLYILYCKYYACKTILYYNVPYYTIQAIVFLSLLYYTAHNILWYTSLYYIILSSTILYCIILYYTILYSVQICAMLYDEQFYTENHNWDSDSSSTHAPLRESVYITTTSRRVTLGHNNPSSAPNSFWVSAVQSKH